MLKVFKEFKEFAVKDMLKFWVIKCRSIRLDLVPTYIEESLSNKPKQKNKEDQVLKEEILESVEEEAEVEVEVVIEEEELDEKQSRIIPKIQLIRI